MVKEDVFINLNMMLVNGFELQLTGSEDIEYWHSSKYPINCGQYSLMPDMDESVAQNKAIDLNAEREDNIMVFLSKEKSVTW